VCRHAVGPSYKASFTQHYRVYTERLQQYCFSRKTLSDIIIFRTAFLTFLKNKSIQLERCKELWWKDAHAAWSGRSSRWVFRAIIGGVQWPVWGGAIHSGVDVGTVAPGTQHAQWDAKLAPDKLIHHAATACSAASASLAASCHVNYSVSDCLLVLVVLLLIIPAMMPRLSLE